MFRWSSGYLGIILCEQRRLWGIMSHELLMELQPAFRP